MHIHPPTLKNLGPIEQSVECSADRYRQTMADASKERLVVQPIDVSTTVSESYPLLQHCISKNAALTLSLATGLPAVQVDLTQLRRVLVDLVTNASDALGEQAGIIAIATGRCHLKGEESHPSYTVVDTQREEEFVYFEISGSGQGTNEESHVRGSDSFFTAESTSQGLSAVEAIVRRNKGILQVHSKIGQASFSVLFPVSSAVAIETVASCRPPSAWHGHGTVLVVDDEEQVRKVASALVSSLGFTVLPAEHGSDAVKRLSELPQVRFVLLDLTMPGMDGEQTLEELHRIAPELPVMLMSGYSERELSDRFTGKRVAGYLQKPFAREQLRQRLQELLGE
jgi:CheY-like chemotaxis protein